MKRAFVSALTLCGVALLLHGQSQQSLRNQLVGTWRFVSFTGNRLTLRAASPLPAGVQEWNIVWERVAE